MPVTRDGKRKLQKSGFPVNYSKGKRSGNRKRSIFTAFKHYGIDDKQEDSLSVMKDFQVGCSWVPPTPAKLGLTTRQPICTEWQDNEALQANWLQLQTYPQVNQIGQTEFDLGSTIVGNLRGSLIDSCTYNFINDEDSGTHLSFGELLARAHYAPNSHTEIDGRQYTLASESSSLGSFLIDSNKLTNITAGGSYTRSMPSIDLNLPCIMEDSTLIESQFAPITPEKTIRNEIPVIKDVQQKEVDQNKKQSELVVNRSYETMFTLLEENHKPDKGDIEDVEWSKTPQQKPRRKKHRPKVIIEGQSKTTPKSRVESPSNPRETTKGKSKLATPSEREINGSRNGKRKYRTGVNKPGANTFDQDERTHTETVRQTRSSCRRSLNFDFDSQVKDERNFNMELQAQNINTKADTLHDQLTLLDELTSTRGKCQIVFSDSTQDKEANTVKVITGSDAHLTLKRPSDSNCNSSTWFMQRDFKRQDMGTTTTVVAEFHRSNSIETFHNSLQAHSTSFQQNAYKYDYSPGRNLAFSSMHTVIASESRAIASVDCHRAEQQNFKFVSTLRPSEGLEKEISEAASVSNLGSLLEMCKQVLDSPGRGAKPHKTVDNNARMMKKKRSNRKLNIKSTLKNIQSHHQLVTRSTGDPRARSWICRSSVDAITELCKRLDLNAESTQDAVREQHNELVAYRVNYQEQHALVPYQRNGALVPFDSSFYMGKRRRPRPKVDLDDETNRVWKLLLENINSEGIDGTDEQNEKWWEEERRVFCGRADSFIARMHLVQGDRRFSPWKGSVLDSVIGVFLTQNVSDHLSSSAFMSLAARFPFYPESDQGQLCGDIGSIIPDEPEVHDLDRDATAGWNEFLNQLTSSKDSKMLPDSDYNDIREVLDLVNSSRNSSAGTLPKDNLCGQLFGFSKNGPDSGDASPESAVNKSICYGWDEKDLDDTLSSQNSTIHSLHSADPIIALNGEITESCSLSTLGTEQLAGSKPNSTVCSTSYIKHTPVEQTVIYGDNNQVNEYESFDIIRLIESASMVPNSRNQNENLSDITYSNPARHEKLCFRAQEGQSDVPQKNDESSNIALAKEPCETEASGLSAESATQGTIQEFLAIGETPKFCSEKAQSRNHLMDAYQKIAENPTRELETQLQFQENNCKMREVSNIPISPQTSTDITGSSNIDSSRTSEHREVDSNLKGPGKTAVKGKAKGGKVGKEKHNPVDWDRLRKQAQEGGRKRERTANTMDSVDWDAVRCADVNEIAHTIRERGMNNMLATRIKDFLNRLVREHGSTDLEWLRDVAPDKAKEYLLSVRGLGLKSVECVRLLTLHHLAFPVDTNVGRIAVRLGWVPLQPLPESLQLHLLELYPVLESIQKFLWPRLCKLDQRTLYELHYQMITFGKVFCTKSKPNCNACPMRGECRHFASAFASARLSLPAPEEKSTASAIESNTSDQNSWKIFNSLRLPLPQDNQLEAHTEVSNSEPIIEVPSTPEPIIEVPATPEPEQIEVTEYDIEDNFEDSDDIPTIQLNMEEFTQNLQEIMQKQMEVQESDMSKALIALTAEAASIPMPKLKNVNRLRTEHQVYELPDSHPLLKSVDKREPDDPCSYLLAIWTPGETADSIQPPERHCSSRESGNLCPDKTCFSCNSIREGESQTVRGTLLIPCRTAMRGSFPLNGTYFQVNEVFADHESSLNPVIVPRDWLWNLPRRTVYFGTSIPTIFKGLTTEGIQYCFWRGFVCVRGFDRKTRAPRPLIARLHFPASKLTKVK